MQTFWNSEKHSSIHYAVFLLLLGTVEGMITLVGPLMVQSEPGSAVLLGLSLPRLVITGLIILAIALLGWLAWVALSQLEWWQSIQKTAAWLTRSPARVFALFTVAYTLTLTILAILFLCASPAAAEITLLKTIFSRVGLVLVWIALLLVQFGSLILVDTRLRKKFTRFASAQLRAGVLLAIATCVYTVFLRIFLKATWDMRFKGLEGYIFIPALVLLVWGISRSFLRKKQSYAVVNQVMMVLFVGLAVYTVYWHTAQWFRYEATRGTAEWHLLANAFLQGKLYLETPATYHDMTFYKGHWYIPNPPLPALILMPLVALFGVDRINMVQFAIFCGSANAALAYIMLSKASSLKMIPTSTAGNLLLTVLLAFGTTHWWLSVESIYWYLSQLLTLLFAGLATILALKKASPWLIGVSLGIAILARPNVFTLWPFLAGITLYLEQKSGPIQWKQMFFWAVKTAVPMAACVFGLLYYNFIRFDNFFDFGYVTINSSSWIMEAVRTYGMFNIHFVPINFKMMFLTMPFVGFADGKFYYSPGFEGTSILAMTPAVIYLFRRFQVNWWTAGAWASVLLTAGLLLFYHNTGSWQLGFRYLMDFILPVLLLIALGVGQRTSRVFSVLVLLSVLINGAGVAWWFTHM